MEEMGMGTAMTGDIERPDDANYLQDDLGAKAIFRIAGNHVFRIDPLPRGKIADVPLQKSKSGLSSTDVRNYFDALDLNDIPVSADLLNSRHWRGVEGFLEIIPGMIAPNRGQFAYSWQ
jgi:hypothetical protein